MRQLIWALIIGTVVVGSYSMKPDEACIYKVHSGLIEQYELFFPYGDSIIAKRYIHTGDSRKYVSFVNNRHFFMADDNAHKDVFKALKSMYEKTILHKESSEIIESFW